MHFLIQAVVSPGEESGYVAECIDLSVVTQGNTLDKVVANLREALALHFEGEDLHELGFAGNPPVVISMQMEPVRAQA